MDMEKVDQCGRAPTLNLQGGAPPWGFESVIHKLDYHRLGEGCGWPVGM